MSTQAPPLGVWIKMLVFVLLAVITMLLLDDPKVRFQQKHRYQVFRQQLAKFEAQYPSYADDECKVLIWGSSITALAVEAADTLHHWMQKHHQREMGIHKIYLLGMDSEKLSMVDELFTSAKRLQPSLILIEDQAFAYEREKPVLDRTYKEFVDVVLGFSSRLLALTRRSSARSSVDSEKGFDNALEDQFFERWDRNRLKQKSSYRIPGFDSKSALNEQLTFAKANQIPIIIIQIPLADFLEVGRSTTQNKAGMQALIAAYREAGFNMEYWPFPTDMPYAYYWDGTHMNEDGRKVYSKWLVDKLADYKGPACSN